MQQQQSFAMSDGVFSWDTTSRQHKVLVFHIFLRHLITVLDANRNFNFWLGLLASFFVIPVDLLISKPINW
ncbi:hypothetical protein RchiOBHm_Chr7g0232001 [Rosa chinensis]|uniref:Uncharacterized protein n=1 Tax=Rosa chinensis TaxID=74649 RepID=A0A2P6PFT3_ROSCH|nr:hypothetical protein RchiOBHm_Chr7g0232001 [Rosa chinensis]